MQFSKVTSHIVFVMLLTCLVAGCSAIKLERTAVPADLVNAATVSGFSADIRYWGDEAPPLATDEEELRASRQRFLRQHDDAVSTGAPAELNFLLLSGGAENGAFGAGLLNGWSEAGTRPRFDVVTGVSTGALIAPFAFLGERYDDVLREAYTNITPSEIYNRRVLANVVSGAALSDSSPFSKMIDQYVTPVVLEAVAKEHATGRQLYVGTTNLDTGRPVVWNMGEIAQGGDAQALSLFRDVIRASAALPAAFPPVPIEVTVNGEVYSELHADGSIASNVFAYAPQLDLNAVLSQLPIDIETTLYVVRNGRQTPRYEETATTWYGVAARSLGLLLHHSSQSSILQIYGLTQRDGLSFRLAYMPEDFDDLPKTPFEQAYMRKLFATAEDLARDGYEWRNLPY